MTLRLALAALLLGLLGCRSGINTVSMSPAEPDERIQSLRPMVAVPSGPFLRGIAAGQGKEDESPQHRIYVSAFFIDTFEVTVEDYKQCVDAGSCQIPGRDGLSCNGDEYNWGRGDRLDHPINCVTLVQARAFCAWEGKRLPTEAEWEKAARGFDGRRWPWGNKTPTCKQACFMGTDLGCAKRSTCGVGGFETGKSPYGAHGMAGNVWEWVSDFYDATYYQGDVRSDPTGPKTGPNRLVRGGSYSDIPEYIRSSYRFDLGESEDFSYAVIGFRCAR